MESNEEIDVIEGEEIKAQDESTNIERKNITNEQEIIPITNNFYPINNQDYSILIVNEILHNIIYSLPVFTCIEINHVQESLETQTEDKNKEDEIIIDKDLQIPPISPNKEEIVVQEVQKETTLSINEETNKEEEKIKNEEEEFDSSLTYMERKIRRLQREAAKSFGALDHMKKSYSRIEREQMKLKEEKENKDANTTQNYPNIVVAAKLLNKKRESDEKEKHSGYTPIKKQKKMYENNDFEDFGTFMEKAKKSKPLIQRQKEQFIYEQNKKKESLLQAKKNEIKEQVFKLDI